ncbi:MAG: beta-mannosidase [Lachnospiraceae bacterium]|nr:beta-mannosidase [Lachnospiraceae bacterium]
MQTPVNPNATPNARKLLDYLSDIAGKKLITGQHTQTHPMEEISYIREKTGMEPKLRGFELLAYSPNINLETASEACSTEVIEARDTLDRAYEWAKNTNGEGIITFSFHWFSPIGGEDKSFYAEHTDFDAQRVLVDGTPEQKAFDHDMAVIADHLERFCEADIPILWRPFHEADGKWFWWGAKGPEVAAGLYKRMYEYYVVERKLNNLLWVWNCPLKEGYPGDEYVDVISRDIYLEEYKATDYADEYRELIEATTDTKVAALAEVGYAPDIDIWKESRVPWAYFMTWSKEFIIGEQYNKVADLKRLYLSEETVKIG